MKHIPIPNRNELDDSKLESVIQKWSATTKQEDNANSKSSRTSSTDDNNSNTASGSDTELKQEDGGNSSQEEESSKEDNNEGGKLDKTCESVEEGISYKIRSIHSVAKYFISKVFLFLSPFFPKLPCKITNF